MTQRLVAGLAVVGLVALGSPAEASCRSETIAGNFATGLAQCNAAIGADPSDAEARLFRAFALLGVALEGPAITGLYEDAGITIRGSGVSEREVSLSRNTTGQGYRIGSTVDLIPFSVATAGPAIVDVRSWEIDEDSGAFTDLNGDGEAAFFSSHLFLFRDDGSLDELDLVTSADFNLLFPAVGASDGSVNTSDSYLDETLSAGSYLLAITPYPTTLRDLFDGFSRSVGLYTILDHGSYLDIEEADHGDYRVTLGGAASDTVDGTLRALFAGLAADSPRGGEVQATLESTLAPALDAAIADLAAITPPFVTTLTTAELDTLGLSSALPIEVDTGDVLLLESALRLAYGALLVTLSYDLDFDLDDAFNRYRTTLDVQGEVITASPGLLTPRPGAATRMQTAREALHAALDGYVEASESIRAEADLQDDDLIVFPDLDSEANFRAELARWRSALDGRATVLTGDDRWKARVRNALTDALGTPFDEGGVVVDLDGLFAGAPSLRPLAPAFTFEPGASPPSRLGAFPDPTFGGILVPEPGAGALGSIALGSLLLLRGRRT